MPRTVTIACDEQQVADIAIVGNSKNESGQTGTETDKETGRQAGGQTEKALQGAAVKRVPHLQCMHMTVLPPILADGLPCIQLCSVCPHAPYMCASLRILLQEAAQKEVQKKEDIIKDKLEVSGYHRDKA